MHRYLFLYIAAIISLLFISPVDAFTFEKDYFIILNNAIISPDDNFHRSEGFNIIENKIFNNNLCDKYNLVSSDGNLEVNAPFKNTITNNESILTFIYKGNMYLNIYECQGINIFDFNFKSDEIDNSEDSSRFVAYKPEYISFNGIPIDDLFNKQLGRFVKDYKPIKFDRNSQLFELLTINKEGFLYSKDFCKYVGYYLINEFHPSIFSDSYNEKLCNMGAYSLLKNHFLYLNELQGFFISDYAYDENYNFRASFETMLVRKLAEKSTYAKYYNIYQTKSVITSAYLSLIKPNDKSKLYDLQSKNANMQMPELLDTLKYLDSNLRVYEYGELALTRIDRKNEMLSWFSVVLGIIAYKIGGLSLKSLYNNYIKYLGEKLKGMYVKLRNKNRRSF